LDSIFSPGKLLVVSPHPGDAVFSCGEMIALHSGTLVATVFSGAPSGFDKLTEWDMASGFLSAEQAIWARKQEDYAALRMLSANPLWLDFSGSDYQSSPSVPSVASVLQEVIQHNRPDTILFPAGLFHADHFLVHQAMLTVRHDYPEKNWIIYEDALYRCVPDAMQNRLEELLQARIAYAPVEICDDITRHIKQQAIHCYASQLQALCNIVPNGFADGFANLLGPERFWHLSEPWLPLRPRRQQWRRPMSAGQ
jgi:LmbE family N-acetylglucosaminyl deacetylase